MKKSINPHPSNIGPRVSVDLEDISVIEEFGDREGSAGWVEAVITLRYGKVINVKLSYDDMDDLVNSWENKPEKAII